MSAIPVLIAHQIKTEKEHAEVVAAQQKARADQKKLDQEIDKTFQRPPAEGATSAEKDDAAASTTDSTPSAEETTATNTPQGKKKLAGAELVKGLAILAVVGLASPFLELASPLSGLIGLVILMVGIRIAWRIAAGAGTPVVEGPF